AGRTLLSYSLESGTGAGIAAQAIHAGTHGLIFNLSRDGASAQVLTHLIGHHNVSNLLLVAGVLQELGWSLSRTARILAELRPVPGRLELVGALGANGTG